MSQIGDFIVWLKLLSGQPLFYTKDWVRWGQRSLPHTDVMPSSAAVTVMVLWHWQDNNALQGLYIKSPIKPVAEIATRESRYYKRQNARFKYTAIICNIGIACWVQHEGRYTKDAICQIYIHPPVDASIQLWCHKAVLLSFTKTTWWYFGSGLVLRTIVSRLHMDY